MGSTQKMGAGTNVQNKLIAYFCEIKSSYNEEYAKEACEQIQSSRLFIEYLLACYRHYRNKDICIDGMRYYYFYPKYPISNKKKPYIGNANQTQKETLYRQRKSNTSAIQALND